MRCCLHPEERVLQRLGKVEWAHRSARRPRKAPVLASRCDAPQHEGAGARRILAERSQRMLARVVPAKAGTHNHGLWLWVPALRPLRGRRPGRRSFGLREHQLAAVRNDRRGSVIVSGLLFTMTFATPTCRPHRALKIMQGNTLADVPLKPPSHSSRSSIDLARRVVVVSSACWCACCEANRTAPAEFKALLRPTVTCTSFHT